MDAPEQDPGAEQDAAVDAAQRISDEIAAIHRESYGETVEAIRTHIMDDVVVCVLDVKLLPHERTLVEHGRGLDSILEVRKHFQESVGATFTAAVEHMTGRRVIAFLSETHIDPPFSIEFFRLAPAERLPGRPGDAVSRG
jgi:uncharacterized protein YbcI